MAASTVTRSDQDLSPRGLTIVEPGGRSMDCWRRHEAAAAQRETLDRQTPTTTMRNPWLDISEADYVGHRDRR